MNQVSGPQSQWWVYLIRMANNALYCGITTDLEKRFALHQQGKGAKALRGKGPLSLVWSIRVTDKSSALKLEAKIKKQPKQKKEALVRGVPL